MPRGVYPRKSELSERTKLMMEEYRKFPVAELVSDQHDEAVDKAIRERGFIDPIPNGAYHSRLRKVVIAGYAPQALSPGDLQKLSASLPGKASEVLKQKGKRKMTQTEKAVMLKNGNSKKTANHRNNMRLKNPSIPVGLPPPPKAFYELVVKTLPMFRAAGLSGYRVIVNADDTADIEFEVRRTYRHPIGRV